MNLLTDTHIPSGHRLLTYANAITAFRIVAAPTVAALLVWPERPAVLIALAVMLLAEASDLIDGHVARLTGQVSAVGKILDPLADATYRGVVFIVFAFNGWISVWLLLPILARDLGVARLREYAEARTGTVAARTSGKIKAVIHGTVQIVIMTTIAIFGIADWSVPLFNALVSLAVLATVLSLADYLRATLPR